MLQQTQAARVAIAFEQFIARFPDVHALAAADQQEVLQLWRGLGYYRRAINLHAAAKKIVAELDGQVPQSADALRKLAGVGRYTAGAIASIVFNQRQPIVDGNVRRVLSRVFAHDGIGENWAWEAATRLVKVARSPGVMNEGLMELGATVCLPRAAKCNACPLRNMCAARSCGEVERYPRMPERAKPRAAVHHAVIVARNRGTEMLMERRSARGMWASMWQTPTIENARSLSELEIKAALPVAISELSLVGAFTHQTTHRTITFKVYRATSRVRKGGRKGGRKGEWRSMKEIESLPMSNAQRRVLEMARHTDPAES